MELVKNLPSLCGPSSSLPC